MCRAIKCPYCNNTVYTVMDNGEQVRCPSCYADFIMEENLVTKFEPPKMNKNKLSAKRKEELLDERSLLKNDLDKVLQSTMSKIIKRAIISAIRIKEIDKELGLKKN